MSKSVDEMEKKENQMDLVSGIGLHGTHIGTENRLWVTLDEKKWGPECFEQIASDIERYELEENKLQLTHETILISVVGGFCNFLQFAYKTFEKNGYKWVEGNESDPLVIAAHNFFLWKWKNRQSIESHLKHCQDEITAIKKKTNSKAEFAKDIYITLYFVESWIKDKAPPKLITAKQPGQIIVPDTFRAVLTDYQFFNKLLHGEELEKIEGKKTKKKDGTPLNGFSMITQRTGAPLPYRDKLILFAIKSIADRNSVIDNGKEVPAFTVSDVVQQLQPKKTRRTVYNKDSELYKEVEASIERMRQTDVAIFSKDYAKNRRLEEVLEGHVVAKKAPLITVEPALWTRRGNIVAGYLWQESDPVKMLFDDFEARFSVQIARDIIPTNLNGEKLEMFAFILQRACANLPTLNTVDIYANGDEEKETLLSELGLLDVSLIKRKLTPAERSKDQSQRKQIEAMLKVFENAELTIQETGASRRVMRFEVSKALSPARKKLTGFTVKRIYETVKLTAPKTEQKEE